MLEEYLICRCNLLLPEQKGIETPVMSTGPDIPTTLPV